MPSCRRPRRRWTPCSSIHCDDRRAEHRAKIVGVLRYLRAVPSALALSTRVDKMGSFGKNCIPNTAREPPVGPGELVIGGCFMGPCFITHHRKPHRSYRQHKTIKYSILFYLNFSAPPYRSEHPPLRRGFRQHDKLVVMDTGFAVTAVAMRRFPPPTSGTLHVARGCSVVRRLKFC